MFKLNSMKTEPTEKEKLIEGLEVGISNCQDDLDAASWDYEEGILISKREAAALLDLAQSSQKIKQLEWVEVWEGYEDARTQFGHYVVRPSIDNKTFLMIDLQKGIQPYLTLNEAKAAAQADFEKRIKECLE